MMSDTESQPTGGPGKDVALSSVKTPAAEQDDDDHQGHGSGDQWVVIEAQYVKTGKAYGLEGKDLRDFVAGRMSEFSARETQRLERAERSAERAQRKLEMEFQHAEQMARLGKVELERKDASSKAGESGASTKLKVPKYDGKQEVAEYLDLFEAVVKQNGSAKTEWPLILRTAVQSTALESSVCLEDFSEYDDIRAELLLSFGTTPSKAWKELVSCKQKSETFRQYCHRAVRLLNRWGKLALEKKPSEVSVSDLCEAVVQQIVLESVDADMAAFLRRSRKDNKSLEAFCTAGTTYQASYETSRADSAKPEKSQPQVAEKASSATQSSSRARVNKDSGSTAQCFKISFDEAERQLFAMAPEKRKSFLFKNKLCRNCLKQGHQAAKCYAKGRCTKCGEKHHVLLHDVLQQSGEPSGIRTFGCQAQPQSLGVRLMTAVAEIKGVSLRARVRVFIDLGSQASFVSSALVHAVKPAKVGVERVGITAFASPQVEETLERFEFDLKSVDGKTIKIQALRKEELGLNLGVVPKEVAVEWSSRGIHLSDQHEEGVESEVHLLLGADYASGMLIEKQEVDGVTAWKTDIGWVLSGPCAVVQQKATSSSRQRVMACVTTSTLQHDSSRVQCLWELEEPLPMSNDKALPAFPLERKEDGYEVGLLWKSETRPEDNRRQAYCLADKLVKRLEVSGRRETYDDVLLKEYAQLKAVEREPYPESPGYYMPHHAVVRTDAATTKVRVVFNAAAAPRGKSSLNDHLDPGPTLLPDLIGLLIRFREYTAAVQADIRKAFFMIGVRQEDRKYLRYLWPDEEGTMTVWRLCKLPFGVNCSPFVLSAVLQHHLKAERDVASRVERDIIDLLLESLYVDDCVTSLPDGEQVNQFRETSTSCLGRANMDLRKWRGNTFEADSEAGENVLGIHWSTSSDTLGLVLHLEEAEPPATRRLLLSAVASLFDPLGLASPVHLKGKILLQRAWIDTDSWDEPLSPTLMSCVEQWWGEMSQLPLQRVPRWIGAVPGEPVEIHVFSDASEKAYGCCVYVVTPRRSELMYAKSKVAPLAAPSLPRLELQAACLAARRVQMVLDSLRVEVARVCGWTDSLVTLHWIRGAARRWKTWVRNRVVSLQEVSNVCGISWRHCPGVENPADLASRGADVSDLASPLWSHGPEWLLDQRNWPCEPDHAVQPEASCELRVHAVEVQPADDAPWWKRLSTWSRLLGVARRLVGWKPASHPAVQAGELQARAEALLIRLAQQECFQEEIAALRARSAIPKQSRLYRFQPFLDKRGVLRVSGRLESSELEYGSKHPALLARCYITERLLEHLHKSALHQGTETVLAVSREEYWILGARRLLRSIKSRCVVCRRHGARCADEQIAPLPVDRVVFSAPFSLCGIDYAGPLLVCEGQGRNKVWIALFVCGITRAVHLELVQSLSVDDFLLAWRRFVSRRRKPQRVRSDNGTTFIAAAKVLHIDWVFNPPSAPWFGGFYERLVGTVKMPLKKVLGKALLSHEELHTVLCEVERAVNSRPLTHVGSLQDEPPLTPAQLIGQNVWQAADASQESSLTPSGMKRRVQYLATVWEHLQKRWMTEYLVTLQGYHAGQAVPVRAGDVVLLVDDSKRRQLWRMARVLQLYPGRDGKSRVALISTGGGGTMLRPIRRLVPLEVSSCEDEQSAAQSGEIAAQDVSPAAVKSTDSATSGDSSKLAERPVAADAMIRTRTRQVKPPNRLNL